MVSLSLVYYSPRFFVTHLFEFLFENQRNMAYPPLWGYLYWPLFHAAAKAYIKFFKDQNLPNDISEQILFFFVHICKYLPCPGCRHHCSQQMQSHVPRFFRGEDFWTYTVDFHNAVNERNDKLRFTYAQAEDALETYLQSWKSSIDTIEETFSMDWWVAILLTSMTYCYVPDKPTDEEKTEYRKFLRSLCYIFPFGHKVLSDGRLCRDVMLECCDSKEMNLDSREQSFEAINHLHNSVCEHFGVLKKTLPEMKEVFAKKFTIQATQDISRGIQMREEDHKKMSALQQELNNLRLTNKVSGSPSSELNAYQTATIALSCILGFLLLALLLLFLLYRFHVFGYWTFVRIDKPVLMSRKINMLH